MSTRLLWLVLVLGVASAAPAADAVSVAVYDVSGKSKGAANLEKILTAEKGFGVTRVTPQEIREGGSARRTS